MISRQIMSELFQASLSERPGTTFEALYSASDADLLGQLYSSSHSVDFVVSSTPFGPEAFLQHPNLSQMPLYATALAPVYRIDSLDKYSPPLVFSRSALALIFCGEIKLWNDTRITATNPRHKVGDLDLPITVVVQGESGGRTLAWTTAMGKFDPRFAHLIPASGSDQANSLFPERFVRAFGVDGVASQVLLRNGAIGFSVLQVAKELRLPVGEIVNRAGRRVRPSVAAVKFATVELASQVAIGEAGAEDSTARPFQVGQHTETLDLTDALGAYDWPIVFAEYLIIDLHQTRKSCATRKAMVDFFLWFYQSPVVPRLLDNAQTADIPHVVVDQLQLLTGLQLGVTCNGIPVVDSKDNGLGTTLYLQSSSRIGRMGALISDFYSRLKATKVEHTDAHSTVVV